MAQWLRLTFMLAFGTQVACSSGKLPEHTASGGVGGPGPLAPLKSEAHSPHEAVVLGALPQDDIRQVIHRNRQQIQYCYELHLAKDPHASGRVEVQFVIAPDGRVSSAHVIQDDLEKPELERCVVARFKSWRFPESKEGRSVQVTYPIRFGAQLDAGTGEVQ